VVICEPGRGDLACGEVGWGRLAEVDSLVEMAERLLTSLQKWKGKKVLITAGPTREPLDPVRFLSNRSSGKMGYALAAEAKRRGAEVVLISGPTSLLPPRGVELIRVETAAEMKLEVERHLAPAEIIIMAAAVADFRPAEVWPEKWKKQKGIPKVELEPTEDILGFMAHHPLRPKKIIVGFAAETESLEEEARKKLEAKGLDLIVANDVSTPHVGFESDFNKVLILNKQGKRIESGVKSKQEISQLILEAVEAYLEGSS